MKAWHYEWYIYGDYINRRADRRLYSANLTVFYMES